MTSAPSRCGRAGTNRPPQRGDYGGATGAPPAKVVTVVLARRAQEAVADGKLGGQPSCQRARQAVPHGLGGATAWTGLTRAGWARARHAPPGAIQVTGDGRPDCPLRTRSWKRSWSVWCAKHSNEGEIKNKDCCLGTCPLVYTLDMYPDSRTRQ